LRKLRDIIRSVLRKDTILNAGYQWPGDVYTCACCKKKKKVQHGIGIEEANRTLMSMGIICSPINLCPECQAKMDEDKPK